MSFFKLQNETNKSVFPESEGVKMNKIKLDLERFNEFNRNGKPVRVRQQDVVDHIIEHYNFFFLGSSADYPYMYGNGVYEPISSPKFMDIIKKYIHRDLLTNKRKTDIYNLLASEGITHRDVEELNKYPKEVINFRNCMYNARTGEVFKHSAKFLSTCQIPYNLDFENFKKPKNFLRFVSQNCNEEKKEMLLEYIGYSMTRDLRFKKALFVKGVQDSGKTVLIDLITSMVGNKNVSSVPLQNLSEQFYTIQIKDKLLNIASDINANALNNSGIFKQIIGGDSITCQEKFKAPIVIKPYCKQIYASNNLIDIIGDTSGATTSKFLYLYWDFVPSKTEYNPYLLETLKEEIPDIICLCMQALKRAYDRGNILETKESEKVSIEVVNTSDNLQAFIFDCCHIENGEKIKTSEFYKRYKEYCDIEGLIPKQKKSITKDMGSKNFHKFKTNGEMYFYNITFSEYKWKKLTQEEYEEVTTQEEKEKVVKFKQEKLV